jgi:AcrR family transcriptional regulator
MAGLRDRQKARRREAIMAAAARLFEERGFEQAAMEEIAAAAELSVATVYNYFRSKGDICLAIYRADRDLVQAATDRVIANPPADPVDAVCRLMEADFDTELAFIDAGAWEALIAAAFAAQPRLAAAFVDDSLMRVQQFSRLLEVLQKRGAVAASTDIPSAAELLAGLNLWHFINGMMRLRKGGRVAGRKLLDAAAKRAIRRQVRQLVAGLEAFGEPAGRTKRAGSV